MESMPTMEKEMDKKKEHIPVKRHYAGGKTGLINIGNTCYMNSILQCLSNTNPLRDYFLSEAYAEDLNKRKPEWTVTREMVRLFNAIWDSNCIIKPQSFKDTLSHHQHLFVGFRQHDSHEVLIFILDLIHKGICYRPIINIKGEAQTEKDKMAVKACQMWKSSHEKEYSFIVELFYGQYHSQSICECGATNDAFQPFCYLPLPITHRTSNVIHCLNEFTHPETLDDDNKYSCDSCKKKTNAKRQLVFWKTPDVLVMTLKRFNMMHKVSKMIDFPLEGLDLSDYVNGYDKHRSVYDLYGVSNHTGGTLGGHYYAYCKMEDGNWYNFNDSSVTPMKESEVVTSAAYVLFYRKRGSWDKYEKRFV